jgi:hypothetical protein
MATICEKNVYYTRDNAVLVTLMLTVWEITYTLSDVLLFKVE